MTVIAAIWKKYFLNIYPKISGNDQIDTQKKDIHRLNGIWCKYMFKDGRFAKYRQGKFLQPPARPFKKKHEPTFFFPKPGHPIGIEFATGFFFAEPPKHWERGANHIQPQSFSEKWGKLKPGLGRKPPGNPNWTKLGDEKRMTHWKLKTIIKYSLKELEKKQYFSTRRDL